MTAIETALLALAVTAALAVQPWRMLRGTGAVTPLATPLLATLVILPWLWAWPIGGNLPVPVQWSGAALAVLMLGWPLAIPVLVATGMSTVLTVHASIGEAISSTVWFGVLPATAVLLLGHAVRRAFGANPLAYVFGRAYGVPLLALFGCTLGSAFVAGAMARAGDPTGFVAAFLMAMGEAAWTCAIVSMLVAWRPQWLATWSDTRYLRSQKSPRRAA
ncbi:MAG: hypothetical protein Q8Q78_01775 [Hydrogenophaga sp.]|nr:hypothetical protein [Hydrogenophaga sp.]